MLNTTYTFGTAPYNWAFSKQFDEANKTVYSVPDLPAAEAKKLTVSKQLTKSGGSRHLVDISVTRAVPGSTSGQTYVDRVYLVTERSKYTVAADIKGQENTLLALCANITFQTSKLAGEQ